METEVPSKLLTTLSHAADIVRGHDFIQVYSHYDADGVSAASIIAQALLREGKEFRVTLFTTLNDYNMDIIRSTKTDCIIMTDLGASYIEQLDAMKNDIVVLDHHTIIAEAKRICYANPHLYGIDGMTSGCGATMALLFAVTLNERNWDLVQIAFAGIAGDRQHINGLSGLNVHLLEEGKKRGYIEEMPGSLIPSGHLKIQLFLTTDPFIRGISGNEEGVSKLLDDAGIDHGKSYMDLSDEEKRKLSSLIAVRLTEQGMLECSLNEIARTRYFLKGLQTDAEYMASILNSCGRSGLGGMGVSAGMGDQKAIEMGAKLMNESNRDVVMNMVDLDSKGLNQMDHIQWFDSSDSGFTGMLCGISMQCIGDPNKPTIGMNRSKEPVNISSRGMWVQLDRGIDLAVAMREACASVGGEGGGHRIAAGGSIPGDMVDQFLKNLDSIIEKQLSSSK
jgi:RecJ-like exonuclease